MTPSTNNEVFAALSGIVNDNMVRSVINAIGTASANNVSHFHLLFQSAGGNVSDRVCLYNLFQAVTFDLTLYNCGAVQSAAAIAYVGAKRRKASAYASFMLHMSSAGTQGAKAANLESLTKSISLDDSRMELIMRKHVKLSDAEWGFLHTRDLWFSGEEAVAAGIANEIGEFRPPKGSRLFSI